MNKKFVRAFALVLAALMCLSLLPLAARADEGHVCQFTPVRTEPTCGEEGYVQMTCEVCGNAGEIIEWIPPTGAHTFMDVVNDDYLFEESDNLCLRPARYWKACAVCGVAAEEAHTEALNKLYEEINQRKNNGEQHTNEEWQKITEDAVKDVDAQYTFSFGGEGHSWVSYERQEATCTSDGWEAYRQCSACGAIDGEYPRIPAKGHRWGEFTVTKEPNCTEDGSRERVCEVCGEKETVAIPALGHTWGAFTVITEPKCEEDGLQEHTCEVCGTTETVAIPALGHTWGAFTVTRPATCTVDGEQERTCAACGKKETEIIPAGHKWGEWVVTVEPGCYSSGERTRTCTVCGEKETEAIAPAHKFGEWVVVMEPTCYSTGEERSTCTVCGETESRWLDMAHKYENGVCVFCGEAQPDAPAVTGTEEPAAEAEETGTEENNTEEGSTEEHTNDTDETPANEPEAEEEPAADLPYTGIQNADAVKNGEIVDEAYVGNVLTAAVTPADHEFIYQWYRMVGEEIEEIPGAYDKSYRLTEEDVGASVYCYVDDEEGSDATTYAVAVLPADQDPNPAPAEEAAAEEAEKSNTLEEAETYAAAEMEAIGTEQVASSAETIADFAEKTGIAADPASITAQNVTPVGANGEKLDNDAVAAAGGVTFEMPLPENYKSGDDIEIYHQNSETGAWEKITNYTVVDNKVIIREQKDFSAFVVVDKNGDVVESETFGAGEPPYTVTFDPNGGKLKSTFKPSDWESQTGTKALPTYDTATRTDYAFREWNNDINGNGTGYPAEAPYTFYDNETLYAQWNELVRFYANGGGGKMTSQDAREGENFKLNKCVFTKPTGYNFFIEWNTEADGSGDSYADEATVTMPEGGLRLYAQWGMNPAKVTFDKNTTDPAASGTMIPQNADWNEPLTLGVNKFKRGDKYKFTGWNTKSDGSGEPYNDGVVVPAHTFRYDTTLYAQWEQVKFEVTFDANGGKGKMDPQPFEKGKAFDLNEKNASIERTGYTFKGWKIDKDGTKADYPDKGTVQASTAVNAFTLYAHWEQTTFTVEYNPNGGSGETMDKSTIDTMDPEQKYLPLRKNTYTKVNHAFTGWKDDDDIFYEDEEKIPAEDFTKDLVLYAQWEIVILFDGNGATSGAMDPQPFDPYGEPFAINKNVFKRDNYEFTGWHDNTNNKDYANEQVVDPNEDLHRGSVTLTAQWKKNGYSITYVNPDDNTEEVVKNIPTSEKVKAIACPFEAKQGKVFAEWNTSSDPNHPGISYKPGEEIGTELDEITKEPKDIKLYAIWEDYATVYFYPGDGSYETQEIPKNYNTKLKSFSALDYKAPTGQTFAYWVDRSDPDSMYFDSQEINRAEDLILDAVYGETISIYYNANGGTITIKDASTGTPKEVGETKQSAAKDREYKFFTEEQLHLKRSGYKFLGWALGAGADKPKEYEGDHDRDWTKEHEPIVVLEGFSNDTTIYAVWEQLDFEGIVTIMGSVTDLKEKGLVGETLTADVNGDKEFFNYKYQWLRDGVEIKNPLDPEDPDYGRQQTYTVTPEDFEHKITCRVTAEDAKGEKTKLSINYKDIELDAFSKEIDIVDNLPEDEDDYLYGLTDGMKYSFNSTDPKSRNYVKDSPNYVTINGVKAFAFTKQGIYRFYDSEGSLEQGSLIATVEVRNWWSLSYRITNRVTTSSTSSSSSSGSKTSTSSTSTTSSGGGTVRMYNGGTQLTATSKITDKSGKLIIQGTGTTSWLVREGANTDLKMIVTPSSNSFAYVSLNGSSYSSFGSGERTIQVSPMEGPEHYEIVFANASSSPKTADESHLGMWSALCFTSLVAASAVLTRSRRRRKNEK